MILDDGQREAKVLDLLTRAARDKLLKVDLALPNDQILIKSLWNNHSNTWSLENKTRTANIVILKSELQTWLNDRGPQAPEFYDIYGRPDQGYTWGLELRTKSFRSRGQVGGWAKEATHCRFYFVDRDAALLFKLTWGGS